MIYITDYPNRFMKTSIIIDNSKDNYLEIVFETYQSIYVFDPQSIVHQHLDIYSLTNLVEQEKTHKLVPIVRRSLIPEKILFSHSE